MPDKYTERLYLEAFLSAMPDLAGASIDPGERPDFVVSVPSGRIGIELTRHRHTVAVGASNPKEQHSLRERTMVAAEKLWYEQHSMALDVDAEFLDHSPLTKSRVPALAQEIADYLSTRVKSLEVYQWVRLKGDTDSEYLPEVHSLRALRVPDPSYGGWDAGGGGWVSSADEGVIRSLVASKESKVRQYRTRADQVWLLITLQHTDAGDVVEAPRAAVSFRVSTAFDRVFTFDILSRRVVEIPIERAA